jgi:hypothetical protein
MEDDEVSEKHVDENRPITSRMFSKNDLNSRLYELIVTNTPEGMIL